MSPNGPLRVGIGGPVGAGKTTLTANLAKVLKDRLSLAVITNDIYTQEDAEALMRMQILPADRVMGVETGGCPHTAIREDASINLAAVAALRERPPDLDLNLIASIEDLGVERVVIAERIGPFPGGSNIEETYDLEIAEQAGTGIGEQVSEYRHS